MAKASKECENEEKCLDKPARTQSIEERIGGPQVHSCRNHIRWD
ncbi:unnamed protein product [Brassica rapa]|uniref:Uncharacterized protein n=1 Tax=Brassica campestris TaxID=3711 RepID=A0A8D9G4A0_BRACM|nr:unnamed protein product [Brassica rapa]CAG7867588.1 unnamed protein product [Brassica rapa]